MYDMMAYNFKIQNLHLLNVQVSGYPLFPLPFMSNFRASLTTSSPMNKPHKPFSLISSSSSSSSSAAAAIAPVSVASNSPNEHSFVVSYLINSCGLSPELALAKSRKLKFNNPEKPDRVLAFFKKHGFTKSDVSNIVAKLPSLLTRNPENVILPRVEFLRSLGLSNREITGVIRTAPLILRRSMENVVFPCYNLLRCLLNSDDEAISVVKGHPEILTFDPEINYVVILLEVGVPPGNIVTSWKQRSRFRVFRSRVLPVVDFRKIVEDVKEMGFDPSRMNFLLAVRTIRLVSKSTWENRVQVLKKYGWSDHEVLLAFEKCPQFILTSAQTIDAVLDFFVNQMGMEAASLANQPSIFRKSLKKMIVRCSIYQVLLEKGLFKNGRKLSELYPMLKFSEEEFRRKFLKPYEDEAPELLTLYQEKLDV